MPGQRSPACPAKIPEEKDVQVLVVCTVLPCEYVAWNAFTVCPWDRQAAVAAAAAAAAAGLSQCNGGRPSGNITQELHYYCRVVCAIREVTSNVRFHPTRLLRRLTCLHAAVPALADYPPPAAAYRQQCKKNPYRIAS